MDLCDELQTTVETDYLSKPLVKQESTFNSTCTVTSSGYASTQIMKLEPVFDESIKLESNVESIESKMELNIPRYCAIHGFPSVKSESESNECLPNCDNKSLIARNLNGEIIDASNAEFQPKLKLKKLNKITVEPVPEVGILSASDLGLQAADLYLNDYKLKPDLCRNLYLTGAASRTARIADCKNMVRQKISKTLKICEENYIVHQHEQIVQETGVFREELDGLADFLEEEAKKIRVLSSEIVNIVAVQPHVKKDKRKCKLFSKRKQYDKNICVQCGNGFPNKVELMNHLTSHTDLVFQCSQCLKVFGSQVTLKRHSIHHEKGLFRCETCGKGFTLSSSLYNHRLTHSKKRYTCKNCLQKFKCKRSYEAHILKCTDDN